MNLKCLFVFFCCLNSCLFNLRCQEFHRTDSLVDSYPKQIVDTNLLVQLIKKDFSTQSDRVRAIYRWITTNIAYDEGLASSMDGKSIKAFSYSSMNEKEKKERLFKSELVTKTMNSKKAVCHGYAVLIEDLCKKLGIECKVIFGNLKSSPSQIGLLPNETNHAWNVVKIDSFWRFIDATLGAGFISTKTNAFKFYFNEAYFFTNPEDFFLNHFPDEEKWLLVSKSRDDYAKLPLFFGYYLQFKYRIKQQNLGIYSSKNNSSFTFNIEGLSESDYLQYNFSSENKFREFDQQDNSKNFEVTVTDKDNDYLSIFVNGKIIVIYKIIL